MSDKAENAADPAAETEAFEGSTSAETGATSEMKALPAPVMPDIADDDELAAFRAWKRSKDANDDGMVEVNVAEPFTLTLDPEDRQLYGDSRLGHDKSRKKFARGITRLPPHLANHWYVRHHSVNPPPFTYPQGSEIGKVMMLRERTRASTDAEAIETRVLSSVLSRLKAAGVDVSKLA
jgi:hypothetical protein